MNLNDPFNRLSRQNQNEYLTFRESLKENNIKNQADAVALLKNIRQRALIISILIVTVSVLIVIFSPKLKGIVVVFALVILLWLFAVTFKGQRYIRRFIAEEFFSKSESNE